MDGDLTGMPTYQYHCTDCDSYFEEFEATGDPKKFESNGFKIWGISGKAQRNGTVLLVDIMLFDTEEAVVICINSTNEDAADKYKSELNITRIKN